LGNNAPMKTDSLFYRIFLYSPSLFFGLIDQPSETVKAYKFDSIEIKQTAFRIDGIFIPKAKRSDRPIYFIEAQMQRDRRFYWRFFAEVGLFLRQKTPRQDWRGVIIWGRRAHDPGVPNHWIEFIQSQRVQIIYLDELPQNEFDMNTQIFSLLIANQRQSLPKAQAILTQLHPPLVTGDFQRELIGLIETILVYKFPKKTKPEIMAMIGTNDLKKTRFYKDVFTEGKEEGREEGREESQKTAVLGMFNFGLTADQIAQSLSIPLEKAQGIIKLSQETPKQKKRKAPKKQ
jgi:predicted transposase/invertase (TIGR01784 family)